MPASKPLARLHTTKTLQDLRGDIRGAEDLNRILSDYFDIMIKSFMMHGGDVVAFSGDAMTVVFPGDDLTLCARQCARCALHILEATKGYSLAGEGLENELTLHNCFWHNWGSLMQQGSDIAPK